MKTRTLLVRHVYKLCAYIGVYKKRHLSRRLISSSLYGFHWHIWAEEVLSFSGRRQRNGIAVVGPENYRANSSRLWSSRMIGPTTWFQTTGGRGFLDRPFLGAASSRLEYSNWLEWEKEAYVWFGFGLVFFSFWGLKLRFLTNEKLCKHTE